jgi:hypothetical protein
MDAGWTLDVLVEHVRDALDALGLDQASGRVSDVPDARTIRYYRTLGLVDRPLGTRSRRKLYGERHRQQLIAIKRLQARGLNLDTIQTMMLSMSPAALADLAGAERPAPVWPAGAAGGEDGRARPFWKVGPPPAPVPATTTPSPPSAQPLAGLQLGPLTLTFAAGRTPNTDDVEALAALAGPVLDALVARGLLATPPPQDPS